MVISGEKNKWYYIIIIYIFSKEDCYSTSGVHKKDTKPAAQGETGQDLNAISDDEEK